MALVLWSALAISWLLQVVAPARPTRDLVSADRRHTGGEDPADAILPNDARDQARDTDDQWVPIRLIPGRKTGAGDPTATSQQGMRNAGRRHGARRPAA